MKAPFIIVALVVLLGSGFLLFKSQQTTSSSSTVLQPNQQMSKVQYVFENPKKSAHFESNTPAHGMVLAGIPINVVIDFNFDLAKPSSIKIEMDGKDLGVGETVVDENKLAMRRKMVPDS